MQVAKLRQTDEPLARRDRDRDGLCNLSQRLRIAGLAGFLEEPRPEGSQLLGVRDGAVGRRAAVQVDHDVDVPPDGIADGLHSAAGKLEIWSARQPTAGGHRQDLQCREPVGDGHPGGLGEVGRAGSAVDDGTVAAAKVVVHPQRVPHRTTHELVRGDLVAAGR